jgi:hypothetical protein
MEKLKTFKSFINEAISGWDNEINDYVVKKDSRKRERGYIFVPNGEELYKREFRAPQIAWGFEDYHVSSWDKVRLRKEGYSDEQIELIDKYLGLWTSYRSTYAVVSKTSLRQSEKLTGIATPDKDVYVTYEVGAVGIYQKRYYDLEKFATFVKNHCKK